MKVVSISLLLALAGALSPAARAIDAASERAERERIASERAQAEATFTQREAACRERFMVTPCLDDARRDRRQTLERLRQQQAILDEAERKQRAAQRMEDIRGKVGSQDAQAREANARERRRERQRADALARAAPGGVAPGASAASKPEARTAPVPSASAALTAEQARRVAEYEKRQAKAGEHREAVERRNAQRAAQQIPSKPLPVPSAPAASGR